MSADKTEFYKKINECNPNSEITTFTVLEGEAIGEKAICTNGKLTWTSEENGFMKRNEQFLTRIKGSGMRGWPCSHGSHSAGPYDRILRDCH